MVQEPKPLHIRNRTGPESEKQNRLESNRIESTRILRNLNTAIIKNRIKHESVGCLNRIATNRFSTGTESTGIGAMHTRDHIYSSCMFVLS